MRCAETAEEALSPQPDLGTALKEPPSRVSRAPATFTAAGGRGQEDMQRECAGQHLKPKVLAPFLLSHTSSVAGTTVPRSLSSLVNTAVSPDNSWKLETRDG